MTVNVISASHNACEMLILCCQSKQFLDYKHSQLAREDLRGNTMDSSLKGLLTREGAHGPLGEFKVKIVSLLHQSPQRVEELYCVTTIQSLI